MDAKAKKAHYLYEFLFGGAKEIIGRGMQHATIMLVESNGAMAAAHVGDMPPQAVALLHAMAADDELCDAAILITESHLFSANENDEEQMKFAALAEQGLLGVEDIPGAQEAVVFSIYIKDAQFIAACVIDRAAKTLEKSELIDLRGDMAVEKIRAHGAGAVPPSSALR